MWIKIFKRQNNRSDEAYMMRFALKALVLVQRFVFQAICATETVAVDPMPQQSVAVAQEDLVSIQNCENSTGVMTVMQKDAEFFITEFIIFIEKCADITQDTDEFRQLLAAEVERAQAIVEQKVQARELEGATPEQVERYRTQLQLIIDRLVCVIRNAIDESRPATMSLQKMLRYHTQAIK